MDSVKRLYQAFFLQLLKNLVHNEPANARQIIKIINIIIYQRKFKFSLV
jgi:hypothetical protein